MAPEPNVNRVEEIVQPQSDHAMPRVVDAETMRAARRNWVVENWILAAMILCVTLFSAGLALYVFVPAVRTLVH
jgi:hypothetical protein